MMCIVVAMGLVNFFVAYVVVVVILGESIVTCVVVVIIFVDRKFVVPIFFGIPTIVLVALVFFQKEPTIVGIAIDRSLAC